MKAGYFPPEDDTESHRQSFPLLLNALFYKNYYHINWIHRTGNTELLFIDWSDSRHVDFPKHRTLILELDRHRHFWRTWYLHDFDRPMAIDSQKESAVIIVDKSLRVARYSADKGIIIENPIEDEDFRMNLEQLKIIGSELFVVAWRRRIYKRIGENQWKNLADAIKPAEKITSGEIGFCSLSGVSENNFYAAGSKKDLWHYNGSEFQQITFKGKHPPKEIYCVELNGSELSVGGEDGFFYKYKIASNHAKFREVVIKPKKSRKSVLGFHRINKEQVITWGKKYQSDSKMFRKYSPDFDFFIDLGAKDGEMFSEQSNDFHMANETDAQIIIWHSTFGWFESENGWRLQIRYFLLDKISGVKKDVTIYMI